MWLKTLLLDFTPVFSPATPKTLPVYVGKDVLVKPFVIICIPF